MELIPVTTGTNSKHAHNCKFREMPPEQFLESLQKVTVGQKDGYWAIAAKFKNNHRSQKDLIARQDIQFDIDVGISRDQIEDTVSRLGYRTLIHSSFNHGNPHEKWRIIFLLDRAVPGDEWKAIYQKLGKELGIEYDKACEDPARLLYTPRQPKNPKLPFEAFILEGIPYIPTEKYVGGNETVEPSPAARELDSDPFSPKSKIMQCGFIKHCWDDAESRPEPEWHAMLTIVSRLEKGISLAHEFSAPYPKYDKRETEQKILHALNDSGPMSGNK